MDFLIRKIGLIFGGILEDHKLRAFEFPKASPPSARTAITDHAINICPIYEKKAMFMIMARVNQIVMYNFSTCTVGSQLWNI
jgi:hypothetical protein